MSGRSPCLGYVQVGERSQNQTANTLVVLHPLELPFSPHGFPACRECLVVRHPPWTSVASGLVVTCLMFVEPFDEMITVADVEAVGGQALENVDVVHKTTDLFSHGVARIDQCQFHCGHGLFLNCGCMTCH